MSYLAAVFYLVLQDEYESFIAFCHVLKHLNWRCVYLDSTPKLLNLVKLVSEKLQFECYEVYQHFKRLKVSSKI